jgi:DNA polymerase-3 subunit delta
MPLLSPEKLTRALAAGERGGVYFLFGSEEFLKEEAASRIINAHLDPATREFNLDQIHAAEGGIDSLASILQTPPMMAEWRVVVVREAQALAASARARAVVDSLLDRERPGLVVVLLGQIPERSRAKFYEDLKRKARAIEFAPLTGADLPGWLMERATLQGVELEPDAARALATAVGPEIGVLERELAKLYDFVGERRRIGVADIEAAVGVIMRQNRWDWFDLVGNARLAEARAALPVLFEARESGVGLVLGLGTHFLRLAIAAAGGERALQNELPPHQRWLAKRLVGQARHWTSGTLAAALDDLLRADRLLKSASLSEEQILDELLLRLQARGRASVAA